MLTWWVGQAYFWKMERKQTLITAIWGSGRIGVGVAPERAARFELEHMGRPD